jgi:hypothetical protein
MVFLRFFQKSPYQAKWSDDFGTVGFLASMRILRRNYFRWSWVIFEKIAKKDTQKVLSY